MTVLKDWGLIFIVAALGLGLMMLVGHTFNEEKKIVEREQQERLVLEVLKTRGLIKGEV